MVPNTDQKSQDYSEMSLAYRPSHADATYDMKYGIRAVAGGGRSSARETIGRVAAGAVAKKLLHIIGGIEVCAVLSAPFGTHPAHCDAMLCKASLPRDGFTVHLPRLGAVWNLRCMCVRQAVQQAQLPA
jgi:chorismate synthase